MSEELERIAELERELAVHVGFLEVLDNASVKFNGMSPSEALVKLREIAGPYPEVPTRSDLEREVEGRDCMIASLNAVIELQTQELENTRLQCADLERDLAAARERLAELEGDKRRLQDLIAQLHGLGLTGDDTAPQVAVEREEVEGG